MSLTQLLAKRLELLEESRWDGLDDLQCDAAFAELHDLQESILSLTFSDPDARLSALTTLLDSNDQPGFVDAFKNRLFDSLRNS